MPEATDEWVADNTGEFETVEEWTESIRERLAGGKLNQVRQAVMPALTEALTGLVDVDALESMVDAEMQSRMQNVARQFQSQGIDLARGCRPPARTRRSSSRAPARKRCRP